MSVGSGPRLARRETMCQAPAATACSCASDSARRHSRGPRCATSSSHAIAAQIEPAHAAKSRLAQCASSYPFRQVTTALRHAARAAEVSPLSAVANHTVRRRHVNVTISPSSRFASRAIALETTPSSSRLSTFCLRSRADALLARVVARPRVDRTRTSQRSMTAAWRRDAIFAAARWVISTAGGTERPRTRGDSPPTQQAHATAIYRRGLS